jgi:hypothetical protein
VIYGSAWEDVSYGSTWQDVSYVSTWQDVWSNILMYLDVLLGP